MRTFLFAVLALTPLAPPPAPAARLSETDVDSTARWVAHVDFDHLRGTQLGQYLLRRMEDPKTRDKFAAFQAIFQFDPRRDVSGLTLYGWGKEKGDGVAILRGRFAPDHLLTLLRGNADYGSAMHGRHTVHSWVDDKERDKAAAETREPRTTHGCFYTADTVVMSQSLPDLRNALDVLDRRRPSLTQSNPFPTLGQLQQEAFLAVSARIAQMENARPRAQLFRNAEETALSLGESNGLLSGVLFLHAERPEMAAGLKMIADGLLALTMLNADRDPGAARLAQAARVEADGNRIAVRLTYPAADFIADLEKKRLEEEAAGK